MNRHYSVYDPNTGMFTGRTISCSAKWLELNTPQGFATIEGRYDELSQRVDVETGEVIDWQPPQPDDDHEWSDDRKRWTLKPDVAGRRRKSREARARIAELESDQLRPQREMAIDPSNEEARNRLKDIEQEIADLRKDLDT
jgi:hypothetical protein